MELAAIEANMGQQCRGQQALEAPDIANTHIGTDRFP